MEYLLNIYDAVSAYTAADNKAKWAEHNPNAAELVYSVEQLRDNEDA